MPQGGGLDIPKESFRILRGNAMRTLRTRLRAYTPGWAGVWARDSGLMLASQLLVTLATSALAILVARTLGPTEFGVFAGFLALSFAISVLVELGIAAWLLREPSIRQAEGVVLRAGFHSHALILGGLTLTAGAMLPIGLGVAIILGADTQPTRSKGSQ